MNRRHLALLPYGILLAGLTLWPHGDGQETEVLGLCLICGDRGLADAILNVLLFVPFGLLLPVRRWLPALLTGLLASAAIEALQLVVPGRHANPADVLYNVLGTAAGVGLGRISRLWLRPSTGVGDRLAAVAAILAMATLPLASWLLQRDLPEPPYLVEWEHGRGSLDFYPGDVLNAGIPPLRLPIGPSALGEQAMRLLERGALLGAVVRAGPPADGLAPLIALYDRHGRTASLLGVDSTDLVFREHIRATRFRLATPDIRARGALDSVATGEVVRVGSSGRGGRRCFLVEDRISCGYGLGGASAWRFLYALNGAEPRLLLILDALWLALLVFPVGYWGRWHLATGLAALIAAYAWLRAPTETGLVPVPPIELLGVLAGLLLGLATRRLVRRATPADAERIPAPARHA